jgi:hypothetical protein
MVEGKTGGTHGENLGSNTSMIEYPFWYFATPEIKALYEIELRRRRMRLRNERAGYDAVSAKTKAPP